MKADRGLLGVDWEERTDFGVPTIMEALSAGMTLESEDVVATGTPLGAGARVGAS